MGEPQEALYLTTIDSDPEPKWRTKAEVDAILLTDQPLCQPLVEERATIQDSRIVELLSNF